MTTVTSPPQEMTLASASTMADAALELGAQLNSKPLTVAVVDAAGNLIVFKRQDQDGLLKADMALGKAWGAVASGLGGRDLVRRATGNPHFWAGIVTATQGRLLVGRGGVLVRRADGRVIGAVGVTGDTSDVDEKCAIHGITRAGYSADAGSEA